MRRIGIDVGGTNTDAVLIENGRVSGAVKAPTTSDVTSGILDALARLTATGVLKGKPLDAVMIGTTHFINAVVQRRWLTKVGALRIGLPASATLPPFCDWPEDLAGVVRGVVAMVEGGHEYDGRPFMPLDTEAIRSAARDMQAQGIRSVAISSAFSPLDSSHEREAATIIAEEIPDAAITCSSDLGRIGLLERENSALLNAALAELARDTITAFEKAISSSGISAPLYITQNDGTVVEAAQAMRLPVYSFASGATNSMRGAAYLSGIEDAMVADVGGTTTDIGQIRHGFPREANAVVKVGGVRTLFRMPDLLSIGLGGGSYVSLDPLSVGPLSVGYRLTTDAIAFGGSQLTTSDIGIAAGLLGIGERGKVGHIDPSASLRVLDHVRAMVEESIDRMRPRLATSSSWLSVGGLSSSRTNWKACPRSSAFLTAIVPMPSALPSRRSPARLIRSSEI
jgi:N-methylhydantoinase A/oxoprolinase/acetone carboxylase beta subunit